MSSRRKSKLSVKVEQQTTTDDNIGSMCNNSDSVDSSEIEEINPPFRIVNTATLMEDDDNEEYDEEELLYMAESRRPSSNNKLRQQKQEPNKKQLDKNNHLQQEQQQPQAPRNKRKQQIQLLNRDEDQFNELLTTEEYSEMEHKRKQSLRRKSRNKDVKAKLYMLNPADFTHDPIKAHQIRRAKVTHNHHRRKTKEIQRLQLENSRLRGLLKRCVCGGVSQFDIGMDYSETQFDVKYNSSETSFLNDMKSTMPLLFPKASQSNNPQPIIKTYSKQKDFKFILPKEETSTISPLTSTTTTPNGNANNNNNSQYQQIIHINQRQEHEQNSKQNFLSQQNQKRNRYNNYNDDDTKLFAPGMFQERSVINQRKETPPLSRLQNTLQLLNGIIQTKTKVEIDSSKDTNLTNIDKLLSGTEATDEILQYWSDEVLPVIPRHKILKELPSTPKVEEVPSPPVDSNSNNNNNNMEETVDNTSSPSSPPTRRSKRSAATSRLSTAELLGCTIKTSKTKPVKPTTPPQLQPEPDTIFSPMLTPKCEEVMLDDENLDWDAIEIQYVRSQQLHFLYNY